LLTSKPAAKGGGTHGAQSDGQNVAQNVGQSVAETNCEKLRSRLRLRRCPDEVSWSQEERAFVVRGRGEGHDRGMNVEEALHLAREGRSADEILKLSYDRALK
jgi:peptidoglycan hydrolase-like amidase